MKMCKPEDLLIETNEIKELMDLLSSIFNIRTAFIYSINDNQDTSEIVGNNGNYQKYCRIIQKELRHKCRACDQEKIREANRKKRPLLYRCYNGLYEMFLPLFIEKKLVGYLHFGQVRGEENFSTIAKECSLYKHSHFNQLKETYNSMTIFKKNKLILISKLFKIFSELIIKNKLIELHRAEPVCYLKRFIKENLHKSIDVRIASDFIGRSPSYVTHKFKQKYGMSFSQYLRNTRIEYAKGLLMNHTIEKTFQLCGFKNRYHFSKVFKNEVGLTPFEYKVNSSNV